MSLTAIYAKKALIGEELQALADACILIENETILEVIPGTVYPDTCISEVIFYGLSSK